MSCSISFRFELQLPRGEKAKLLDNGRNTDAIRKLICSFIAGLRSFKLMTRTMVVVPQTVLIAWRDEFKRVDITATVYLHNPFERHEMLQSFLKESYKVLLTTYNIAANDHKLLKETLWDYMIIDEKCLFAGVMMITFETLSNYEIWVLRADARVFHWKDTFIGKTPFGNREELNSASDKRFVRI